MSIFRRTPPPLQENLNIRLGMLSWQTLPEAVEIDRACHTNPMGLDAMTTLLKVRGHHGVYATYASRVIGFTIYQIRPRQILFQSLAVHPEYRREGVGTRLMNEVLGKLDEHRPQATILVGDNLADGHLFLRRLGWLATEVTRSRQADLPDAYRFEYWHKGSDTLALVPDHGHETRGRDECEGGRAR